MKLKRFEEFSKPIRKEPNVRHNPKDFLENVYKILNRILTKSIFKAELTDDGVYVTYIDDDSKWVGADKWEIGYFDGRREKSIARIPSNEEYDAVARRMKSEAERLLL